MKQQPRLRTQKTHIQRKLLINLMRKKNNQPKLFNIKHNTVSFSYIIN